MGDGSEGLFMREKSVCSLSGRDAPAGNRLGGLGLGSRGDNRTCSALTGGVMTSGEHGESGGEWDEEDELHVGDVDREEEVDEDARGRYGSSAENVVREIGGSIGVEGSGRGETGVRGRVAVFGFV